MPHLGYRYSFLPFLAAFACAGMMGCARTSVRCGAGEAIVFSEISNSAFGDSVSVVCTDGSKHQPLLKPAGSRSFVFVNGRSLAQPLLVTAHERVSPGRTEDHLFYFSMKKASLALVPGLVGLQGRAALSSDGSMIAYESAGDQSAPLRLAVTNTKSGQTFLSPTASRRADHFPTWSPDGKELMFIRFEPGAGTVLPILMKVSVPPAEATVVFGAKELVASAAYSPDGRRFAIWSRNGLEIVDRETLDRKIILETSSLAPRTPGTAGLILGSGTLAFTLYN